METEHKLFVGFGIIIVCGVFLVNGCNCAMGVKGWGPTKTEEIEVKSKHVDISGSGESKSSHYMLTTDKGTYEVDNGILLGIWNSDEIYGKMQVGKKYRITTKGNKVVNFFMQEYPYITKVEEVLELEKQ